MEPCVSVVTASLNSSATIEQTILSVLNQTCKNVEHIIIDGGSKDNTVHIIEKYKGQIAYYESEPNAGISDAFNKGIRRCRGRRICIIGADDWLEPDAVEKIIAADTGEDVLHGKMRYWYTSGESCIVKGSHLHLKKEQTINFPATFIKRETYSKAGVYNLNYRIGMDYELFLRYSINNLSFKYVDELFCNMRAGGISDYDWRTSALEVKRAKNELLGQNIGHTLYAYKQIMAIYASKKLLASPLAPAFHFYRKHFAMIKKERV
jgi:glycosyltransferase involved in cell wall biosynthesis